MNKKSILLIYCFEEILSSLDLTWDSYKDLINYPNLTSLTYEIIKNDNVFYVVFNKEGILLNYHFVDFYELLGYIHE